MMRTRTLILLIFDDVEVLDFCGPFEVFTVAGRFTDPPAFNVLTVAEKAGPVLARNGLSVNPHHQLLDCPPSDVLLIPGGQGTRREMHNPALIDWIKQASLNAELLLSVCTGALLLAKAGLLDGLEAATHHSAIDLLRQSAPTHDGSRRPPLRGQWPGDLLGGDCGGHRHEPARHRQAARQRGRGEDGPADGIPLAADRLIHPPSVCPIRRGFCRSNAVLRLGRRSSRPRQQSLHPELTA